jgi:glutathione S-transferase/RNA polymerase-associated protein
MILYEHPLSPYAQKVKIALREKNVPFEARLPRAIGTGSSRDEEFVREHPRLEVPLLVDGDARIFDSTIILEYIEDRFPHPPLLPAAPAARARARTIEDVMDSHYEPINWGLSEIRYFFRAEGELAERLERAAAEQTRRLQGWLADQLGGSEWFGGDTFGWTDLAVVPFVNGSAGFGLAPAPGSPLSHWLHRANARRSVQRTRDEAVASVAGMSGVADLVARGLFRRQYRDHRLEWMIRSGGLEIVERGLERGNIRFTEFPSALERLGISVPAQSR